MKKSISVIRMMLMNILLILIVNGSGIAQTYTEPTSPAYQALVKEYVAAFKTGDLTKFKAALPAVEKAHPGHPNTLFFRAFYTEAADGDLTAAMKGYSDVIRLKPDFTEAYQHRAGLFYKKGMDDRAVADMDRAIEYAGKDVFAAMYGDRAEFKYWAGDYAGSFADYKKAVEMEPAVAKYYSGLASVSKKMGNAAAAEGIFNSALRGAKNSNGAIHAAFADFLMYEQKFAESDEQSKLMLSAAGYVPKAYELNTAGIAALKLRDYPRAIVLLDRGIAADPSDANLLVNRASVAIEQKAWEDVYAFAQKALAVNPNSSRVNMMMAVGISRTNRGEALATEYETKAKKLEAEGK